MNFESILIITYGRSGSTLLQGILNSYEEVLVRGENHNFCQGLFQSYKALIKTKRYRLGTVPTNPFFGSVYLDESYFLSMARKMVKNLLYGDQIGNEKIKCYGFKEVRYEKIPLVLNEYLNFLKLIFPNPAFIINTRNKEDVLNSREKNNWTGNKSMDSLKDAEKAFFEFADNNPDCTFHITYEDVIGRTERISLLHSFLGLQYAEQKISEVLSFQHSNTLIKNENLQLQTPAQVTVEDTENFKIVSFEERDLRNMRMKMRQPEVTDEANKSNSLNWFVRSFIKFLASKK